jgi:uncharacterized LabA/DUF88 family protein
MSELGPPAESGPGPQDPPDATLVFREQIDGRKVARLPGGKVVLVDLNQADRVRDGEAWFVRLRHRDTFAIADPVERVTGAALEAAGGPLANPLAHALRSARVVAVAPAAASPVAVPDASSAVEPPQTVGPALDISRLVRPSDRVALFIDGANTDGAARAAGYFIDFRKAREFFVGSARFYAAFYYVADFTASDPLQQRFFDFLSYAGYIVRRRPVKVIVDPETGERTIKGNLDTEIVLDLLNTVDNYDVAFLFSGDSDFERAVELLRSRGKRVYVVSSRGPLSRELAYVADKPIVYLEEVRGAIARSEQSTAPS